MRAVTVRSGIPDVAQFPSLDLSTLQSVVGGYIEPLFTIPSPTGEPGEVTAYVNEEGWMLSGPRAFVIRRDDDNWHPVAGDVVIVGLTDEGKTRELSPDETLLVMAAMRKTMGVAPIRENGKPLGLFPALAVLDLPRLLQ